MAEAFKEFWDFSLAIYGRPGVAPACLALQDGHGKDVIIALFCCWLGASGRPRLDPAGLAAADDAVRPWRQQVVETLRRTRHALKGVEGAEELYRRMKAIELDAERVAFRRLALLAPDADTQVGAAERRAASGANLALYVGALPEAAAILAALADMSG